MTEGFLLYLRLIRATARVRCLACRITLDVQYIDVHEVMDAHSFLTLLRPRI